MAGRPQKNNLDYFRHEKTMRNDLKIRAVRSRFNNFEGYGIYCMMIEALSDQDDLKIEYDSIRLELLAGDFGSTGERIREVLEYFFKIDLMQLNSGFVSCRQLEERHDDVIGKRFKSRIVSTEMPISATEMPISATTIELPSRVKLSKDKEKDKEKDKDKEKKSIKENIKFIPPTFLEVEKYFSENGYPQKLAERFFKGYSEANWKDSRGNQIKNWKQKAQQVWFRDDNRSNNSGYQTQGRTMEEMYG
jgi:hypothetical protein